MKNDRPQDPEESSAPTPSVVCFDDFEVDLGERKLRREGRVIALQEKPFTLLEALLARPGVIVSRDDLYQILWPDAEHLDFDASLNVAARKLRQALEDSTDEPRWFETVPRRGYRLKVQPMPKPGPGVLPRSRRVGGWASASFVVAGLIALFWLVAARMNLPKPQGESPAVIRLAIMPFELASSGEPMRQDLAPISEWLVAELATRGGHRLEVIGPRTTATYEAKPFPHLKRLANDLDADYVLNARTVEDAEVEALLVELIRLSDGAHPWVEFFDDVDDWRRVAGAIRRGVGGVLGL